MAKISVDKNTCIGCGSCEAICPKSFKLVSGKAKPINSNVEKLTCEKEAESSCPVGAIKVE
jgi:ferredoxin